MLQSRLSNEAVRQRFQSLGGEWTTTLASKSEIRCYVGDVPATSAKKEPQCESRLAGLSGHLGSIWNMSAAESADFRKELELFEDIATQSIFTDEWLQ